MLNLPDQLDGVFSALADPTRRTIVERLGHGPATVSELAEPLPMSLSAVIQHLRILEATGVVRSEKAGRVRRCHLDPAMLDAAEHWIAARRAAWQRRFDRLARDRSP